jgi:CO dehydrogenase nickel-insertion accessory protein CooC1
MTNEGSKRQLEKTKMQAISETLSGKRIGVFGKGGAGKSTLVVLLARALHARGCKVCIVDADSTNVGLSRALGVSPAPKTLLDYYGGMVFRGGKVTCPVDDPTPLQDAEIYCEELSPEYYAFNQDGIGLMIAGKIGTQGPGAGCDGPISKIARDIILRHKEQDPITMIDFKAGFEDSARGAITSLDYAVVVIDPTTASVEMAANMRDMVQEIQAETLPATAHLDSPDLVALANRFFRDATIKDVFFVLNRVRNAKIEGYLREKLLEKDITPLGVIHEDPSIPMAWLKGLPVHAEGVMGEVYMLLEKLVESLDGGSKNPYKS